jgi:hypothetical protein
MAQTASGSLLSTATGAVEQATGATTRQATENAPAGAVAASTVQRVVAAASPRAGSDGAAPASASSAPSLPPSPSAGSVAGAVVGVASHAVSTVVHQASSAPVAHLEEAVRHPAATLASVPARTATVVAQPAHDLLGSSGSVHQVERLATQTVGRLATRTVGTVQGALPVSPTGSTPPVVIGGGGRPTPPSLPDPGLPTGGPPQSTPSGPQPSHPAKPGSPSSPSPLSEAALSTPSTTAPATDVTATDAAAAVSGWSVAGALPTKPPAAGGQGSRPATATRPAIAFTTGLPGALVSGDQALGGPSSPLSSLTGRSATDGKSAPSAPRGVSRPQPEPPPVGGSPGATSAAAGGFASILLLGLAGLLTLGVPGAARNLRLASESQPAAPFVLTPDRPG